jgi:hypothetical protein
MVRVGRAEIDVKMLGAFEVRNLKVNGNKANGGTRGPTLSSYMILLYGSNSSVRNVEACNGCYTAIVLGPSVSNVKIIDGCNIHDNEVCGIINAGTPAPSDVLIQGNTFKNNYLRLATLVDCNAINLDGTNIRILGNYFENNYNGHGGQIDLSDGVDGSGKLYSVISDNIIRRTGTVTGESTAGIEVHGSAVVISGNLVENAAFLGAIYTENDCTDNLITGNRVSGVVGIATYKGVGAAGPRKQTIVGNHITYLAGVSINGINIDDVFGTGNEITIAGNFIHPSIPTAINGSYQTTMEHVSIAMERASDFRFSIGYDSQGDGIAGINLIDASTTGNNVAVRFTQNSTIVGTIGTTNSVTSYNTSSDRDLKTDPRPVDSGAVIDRLEVWDFEWKNDPSRRGVGVFAQDAYEVFPNAVTPSDAPGGWAVDYSKFVPLLLAEVKALRARTRKLQ